MLKNVEKGKSKRKTYEDIEKDSWQFTVWDILLFVASQLFLFTGENTYTLQQELIRWKESFIEKYGEANLRTLTGKECVWSTLLDEACSAPFLSEKRLIVIDGLPPKLTKEELEILLAEMHEATIVTFTEPSLDKRKGVTKFLLKNAEVRTFAMQSKSQLAAFVQSLAKEHGITMDRAVADHLIARVGMDQWHVHQECLKALAFSAPSAPRITDIDAVCLPSEKHTVWVLSDLIGKGNVQEAVQYSAKLHESGEDAFRLWNLFLWIVNNLTTIWIWQNEKNLPVGALSKEAGVPFPSVQSLLPCAKKLSQEDMCAIVESVVDADHALKTGGIKATGANPTELITLLERQMLMLG